MTIDPIADSRKVFVKAYDSLEKNTRALEEHQAKMKKANLENKKSLTLNDHKLYTKESKLCKAVRKDREALDDSMARLIGALMDKPDRNEKEQSELIRMKKKLNDVRRARLAFVHSQVDSFVPPPGSCATMSVSQMYEIQRLGKLVED